VKIPNAKLRQNCETLKKNYWKSYILYSVPAFPALLIAGPLKNKYASGK
jgi:hypothetical protein